MQVVRDGILIGHQPLIVPRYKLVFFLLPKNCTGSIKRALRPFDAQYIPMEEVPDHYHKVALVRDPADRLWSCYKNKVTQPDVHITWKENDGDPLPTYPEMSFDEFAKLVCDRPDDISDRHYRSQSTQLKWNGKFLPNILIRYENLEIDWKITMKKILPVEDLPHNNASRGTGILGGTIVSLKVRYKEDYSRFRY